MGIAVPRKTPPEVVERLNREVNAGLADAPMRARFADLGAAVFANTPADFEKLFAADIEKWARVIKFSGAKAD